MGIALAPLTAQSGNKPTDKYTFSEFKNQDVYCKDAVVDNIEGELNCSEVDFFRDGIPQWGVNHCWGTYTSTITDEVFTIHNNWKGDPWDGLVIEHYNFVGDKGSHYLMRRVWDSTTGWTSTIIKSNCN